MGGFNCSVELCLSYQKVIKISRDSADQSELIDHLRLIWRRWSRITGSKRTSPFIRRALSVIEPSSLIHLRHASNPQASKDCQAITVVSANLCHDWPFYRRQIKRLEDFARLVEQVNADIILLQEVSRTQDLKVDKWLVERLGMSSVYTRANGSLNIGFEEGLAVLSRYPLTQPRLTHLRPTATPFIHRLALGARASTPAGKLWVFSVHLGLQKHSNDVQQASLRHMIKSLPIDQPALLAGDFNSHETSPQIRENSRVWIDTFRHLNPETDAATHSFKLPWGSSILWRRLDYIFLRAALPGWEIQETGLLHSGYQPHSDHRAVYARLAPTSMA
jgi:endonuclease/exonuclease/phosphatase family metal-dependent hydrolase